MNDHQSPSRNDYDDEISLVDLAVIFVRRRRVFYLVFAVCVILGVGYAVLADSTYRYTSLVQVAMTADGEPLTEPPALIAALSGRWLPEVESSFETGGGNLPFEVTFGNPEDTSLVKISSDAKERDSELVNNVHSGLVGKLSASQKARLEDRRKRLQQQIKSAAKLLESLRENGGSGEAIAAATDRQLNLQQELSGLAEPTTLVIAQQSSKPTGPRRALIIAASLVLAILFGGVVVFLSEFIALVRRRL